eukprot:scaffold19245_cov118-Isochrysis_galbana.AAC.5
MGRGRGSDRTAKDRECSAESPLLVVCPFSQCPVVWRLAYPAGMTACMSELSKEDKRDKIGLAVAAVLAVPAQISSSVAHEYRKANPISVSGDSCRPVQQRPCTRARSTPRRHRRSRSRRAGAGMVHGARVAQLNATPDTGCTACSSTTQ